MEALFRFVKAPFGRTFALGMMLALIAVLIQGAISGQGQSQIPLGLQWRAPELIPGYDINAHAPYLIAGTDGKVYAFNSIQVSKDILIVYSEWTPGAGWTTPIDVVLSPWKQKAHLRGVVLDDRGVVHLVFYGGDDLGAAMFYTSAPLTDAGNAAAWETPMIIGEDAVSPITAAFAGDGKGELVLVYNSATEDGLGLYSVISNDYGASWTQPSPVFLEDDDLHWPSSIQMIRDDDGNYHAVWSSVNSQGNGDFIYYARMDVMHKQWSSPSILATKDEGDYEVDWASIVSYHGELIVVYDDSNPATRWMRRSFDGGLTWTEPVRPFNYEGEYGHAAFVIDSSDNLHMFLGNRTRQATHGMWHSLWLNDHWSDLEPVVAGPSISDGPLITRFDPSQPRAVLLQGNLILLIWSTDPGAGQNGVWYTYTELEDPQSPLVPLPTQPIVPTPTHRPVFGDLTQPTRPPVPISSDGTHLVSPPSPSIILLSGFLPALGVIAAITVWSRYKGKQKK